MSSKPPRASPKFKSNPTTIKYISKNSEIVHRAIIQANIIFPTSRLGPVDSQEYYTFRDRSFWKLDSIIKSADSTVTEAVIDTIIVETRLSVDKFVAVRERGYDADIARFKLTEELTKKLLTNIQSAMEILEKISTDPLLLSAVMNTMKGFHNDSDLLINEATRRFKDHPLPSLFEYAPEIKPLLFIMTTLGRIKIPLLRLKDDLADSKSIRIAAEYRCASALAWIWWENLGRLPTTTRNIHAKKKGSAPKTAFQSFVEEAVPSPPLSEGILRKVYDDLRFITNVGITEKDARELLLKARSDTKLREKGIEDARSLLLFMRGSLGDRGRRNSGVRNPQVRSTEMAQK